MATKTLTTSDDNITGSGGADTIYAFMEHTDRGFLDDQSLSTLNPGDKIDGGGGDDTLVVDIALATQYVPADGQYETVYVNDNFGASISNIEKLVLTGGFFYEADDSNTPAPPDIDLSAISGLKEVWLAASSTYGQTDADNAFEGLVFDKVSSKQAIGVDGSDSDPTLFYGVDIALNYAKSAKTATFDVANGGYMGVTLAGAALTKLTINATGDGTGFVDILKGDGAGFPKLDDLVINTEKGAHLAWMGGFVQDLQDIFAALGHFHSPKVPPRGASTLEDVTVTGKGGAVVDLTENKENVTFKGSDGDDAVLVDMNQTNKKDKFDGGDGRDVFGIDLVDAPKSEKTVSLTDADYAMANKVAKHFEVFGVMGDFQRPLLIDAAKITMADQIMVGQTARITDLADNQQVDFQLLGFSDSLLRSDLTLVHATKNGVMTGDGTVHLDGGDVLGFGGFLAKTFGEETLGGTAHLDKNSLYETLVATGDFDLEIDSAQTWKDSHGKAHGITVDASHLGGDLTAVGTALDDTFTGGKGDDMFTGGKGNDTFNGAAGVNTVSYADAKLGVQIDLNQVTQAHTGGDGTDSLNSIQGVIGSAHDDTLTGNGKDNVLTGGDGDDRLDGGGGSDTASYATATSGVTVDLTISGKQDTGGAGSDTLISIENIAGSAYDDTLTGDDKANTIIGGGGNDTIHGGDGNDVIMPGGDDFMTVIDGGKGTDTVSFANYTGDFVTADLSSMTSVENLIGSRTANSDLLGDDNANTITGGNGNDDLFGHGGDDRLIGGAGNDTLYGNDGLDEITGGKGADKFFLTQFGGLDTITDFSSSEHDQLLFDSSFGITMALHDSQLLVTDSADATTAAQRFIFDTQNQTLYFDADGSGAGDPVAIAVLEGVKTLTVNDFFHS